VFFLESSPAQVSLSAVDSQTTSKQKMEKRTMFMRFIKLAATAAIMASLGASAALADSVIRIGGVANYGPVLPVKVAQALKLFEKAGVKVEFTNFSGGSASMEGLAAGEVDLINFFPPGMALAKRRGVKATIVSAGTLTPRGWHIAVKKDSAISSLKDLAGKKIGGLPPNPAAT
jgi:NitT/TauT family transport system substrate-binding protein